MRIAEISNLSPGIWRGGKADLGMHRREAIKHAKPLPGVQGINYVVSPHETRFIAIDPARKPSRYSDMYENVGELYLKSPPGLWIEPAYRVDTITVDEDYRNRGIASGLYMAALRDLQVPILAGDSQSSGGRRNWARLYNTPGVTVLGYGKLEDDVFEDLDDSALDKLITAIMESGGNFIGEVTQWSTLYHVFTFDVRVDPKKTLQNAVHRSKIETYGRGAHPFSFAEIGLVAYLDK